MSMDSLGRGRRQLTMLALAACAHPAVLAQVASAYPNRPVRLVVPFAAGGSPDVIGRELANALTLIWGQSAVIENRGGASGVIGAEAVARSVPDGYTLLLGTDSTLVTSHFFQEKVPFDSQRDFVPIGTVANFPLVLISNPASGFRTLEQFVAAARAKPGTISYASVGPGSSHHISMEFLSKAAGLKLIHVPYKGGAPALQDLLAGHLPIMFSGLATSGPYIKAGKVNVLAVTSAERFPLAPDIPTVAEQGYPGFNVGNWLAVLGPKGLPREIAAKIQADLERVTGSEAFRARLAQDGVEAWARSGDELARRIRSDFERTASLFRKPSSDK